MWSISPIYLERYDVNDSRGFNVNQVKRDARTIKIIFYNIYNVHMEYIL